MSTHLTKQGLPRPADDTWRSYLEEWDRSLRAQNRPATTRYNYQLAVTQLADFLGGPELPNFLTRVGMPYDDDSDVAHDPADTEPKHIEWFIAWMIDTRSASTALNKYKSIQQFYNYLLTEEDITRHPMSRLSQPHQDQKLVPILTDEQLTALLAACAGKGFAERRDTAIVRLLLDTGARLSEISTLTIEDLDLRRDLVVVTGKGNKQRGIPFGEKTGQALARYQRARAAHAGNTLPQLFLATRGRSPLNANGIKIMLRRRGLTAGITHMHAHRLRHTLAHQWQLHHGNESDLMAIMGWESPEMLRHYGRSAAAARADNSHRTLRLGNRV